MSLFLVLAAFICIALTNVPGMVRSKCWRNLVIYGVFFIAALAIGILMSLDIPIPSPVKGVQTLYKDVLHISFKGP